MIDDEQFLRGKIPMTKQEIRILTLAKARLNVDSIVADIGAGTGSITIEAAKISSRGKIFAIERKSEAIELIKRNVEKFSVDNVTIIHAEAPDGLRNVPRIDVAFVGGSGGKLEEILNTIDAKLKSGGRIIVNCITVQTLAASLEYFKNHESYRYEAIQVQINRMQNLGFYDMSKALNPVYIVTARKSQRKQQSANVVSISNAKIGSRETE